jgi:Sulfotransferase family
MDAATRRVNSPDFFIIGQPKCGTTAMYEMLSRHPQIFMPELKEPHFFVKDAAYRNAPATLDEYLSLFDAAQSDQCIGEASASYLWSCTAAEGIAKLRPDAKLIAILREPASLMHSLHLQMLESRVEIEKDLRTALELEDDRRVGRRIPASAKDQTPLLFYSEHVRYVKQLRRYRELFPLDQFLLLIYDDFRADNAATLRAVLRFLELDETPSLPPSGANPTVQVRSPRLDQILHSVSMGEGAVTRTVKRGIKAITPTPLRRRVLSGAQRQLLRSVPRPPDEELMAELRHRYQPEVEALGEYIGRDLLTEWSSESAD